MPARVLPKDAARGVDLILLYSWHGGARSRPSNGTRGSAPTISAPAGEGAESLAPICRWCFPHDDRCTHARGRRPWWNAMPLAGVGGRSRCRASPRRSPQNSCIRVNYSLAALRRHQQLFCPSFRSAVAHCHGRGTLSGRPPSYSGAAMPPCTEHSISLTPDDPIDLVLFGCCITSLRRAERCRTLQRGG